MEKTNKNIKEEQIKAERTIVISEDDNSDLIYKIFTARLERRKSEEKTFTDSMKKITNGKGFIITNSRA